MEERHLIASAAILEEENLLRSVPIAIDISIEGRDDQLDHLAETLLVGVVDSGGREDGAVGGVDGGSQGKHVLFACFCVVECCQHATLDLAALTRLRHPQSVSSFGNDLQEDFSRNRLYVFVAEFGISEDLGDDFLLADSTHLDLLVLGFQIVGNDDAADVVLLGNGIVHLLLNSFHTHPVNLILVDAQLNTQVAGGIGEGVQDLADIGSSLEEHGQVDWVLRSVNWLVEEVEACLLSSLNAVLVSQLQHRCGDGLRLDFFHVLMHFDSHLLQGGQFLNPLQFVHETTDLLMLLARRPDGEFGDLLPPHFIEIIGNSCHEHEFWDKEGGLVVLSLALGHKQRLFHVADGQ